MFFFLDYDFDTKPNLRLNILYSCLPEVTTNRTGLMNALTTVPKKVKTFKILN